MLNPLDILMLTRDDWANTGWRTCQSLRAVGYRVEFYKGRRHAHQYPVEAPLYEGKGTIASNLLEKAAAAKALHFTASTFIETGVPLAGKVVVVQHGGSRYRNNAAMMNKFWNPIASATIVQMPDLYGLGARNEVYMSFPVDVNMLQEDRRPREPGTILIGHWPSNPETKGTDVICRVIDELTHTSPTFARRCRYIGARPCPAGNGPADVLIAPGRPRYCDTPRLTWAEHLDRVRQCDVYIEALCPTLDGRQYGTWGNAAHEAAALGKIVITHGFRWRLYEEQYHTWPALWIANSADDLKRSLTTIAQMSDKLVDSQKACSAQWAELFHSFYATGSRLRDKVYGPLGIWPSQPSA